MMITNAQPPIITHTAATPQDSPNTTLDLGYRDINSRAIYPTALSFESIDRTSVSFPSNFHGIFLYLFPVIFDSQSQGSVCSAFLRPSDNNNKFNANNLINQSARRLSKAAAAVTGSTPKESVNSR